MVLKQNHSDSVFHFRALFKNYFDWHTQKNNNLWLDFFLSNGKQNQIDLFFCIDQFGKIKHFCLLWTISSFLFMYKQLS